MDNFYSLELLYEMKKLIFLGISGLLAFGGLLSPISFADDVCEGFGCPNGVKEIKVPGTDQAQQGGSSQLLDSTVKAINWVLEMLASIALLMSLWGGFQMLTAAGNEGKVKTGKTVIKNAALGIAVILLSWSLVSLIFWFIKEVVVRE